MKRVRTGVVELEWAREEVPAAEPQVMPEEVARSPMYGVALLKIAMEMKRAPELELDEILRGVLGRMRLDEAAFRRFLEQNGGLLRAIARKKEL